MDVINLPSPNFDDRPVDGPIDILLLHYTGMQSADEAINRLRDPAARVSSHYVIDEDGSIAAQWPAASGPPYTFIIDRQGRIAARILGGVTPDELQTAVLKVSAEA